MGFKFGAFYLICILVRAFHFSRNITSVINYSFYSAHISLSLSLSLPDNFLFQNIFVSYLLCFLLTHTLCLPPSFVTLFIFHLSFSCYLCFSLFSLFTLQLYIFGYFFATFLCLSFFPISHSLSFHFTPIKRHI